MGPKMSTEHAQMYAGKCERCWKVRTLQEKGNWEKEKGGYWLKSKILKLTNKIKLN